MSEQNLNSLVANLVSFRLEAKNAHWNSKGPSFYQFHLLFDRIYDELDDLIDRLAEKMKSMNMRVLGSIENINSVNLLPSSNNINLPIDFCSYLLNCINLVRAQNDLIIEETKDQSLLNILADIQETLDVHKYLLANSL